MAVLKPEKMTLNKYLTALGNYQFTIPVFQRSYTWNENDQIKTFINDYEKLLINKNRTHYIGTFYHVEIAVSMTFKEYSIVDAQQRIITSFLMLKALKDIAEKYDFKDRVKQIEKLLYAKEDDRLISRLKPSKLNVGIYEKILNNDFDNLETTEKNDKVYRGYLYIKNRMEEMYQRYNLDLMLEAFSRFEIIVIPLDQDKNDIQVIFESINSTGKQLGVADLIRNFLFMGIDSSSQEELYDKYWLPMEKEYISKFGDEALSSFFRIFLANQLYSLKEMNDIYEQFKEWNDLQTSNNVSLENMLKIIKRYSKYYEELFLGNVNSIRIEDEKIKQKMKEFRKLTTDPVSPFLIEMYRLYETFEGEKRKVSGDQFASIIELFNTYIIRRDICNLRTGVLTRMIPSILKKVIDDSRNDYSRLYELTYKYLVIENRDKASRMPDNAEIKTVVSTINAYALKNYYKVVLEKIEGNGIPVDFENLTIEHIAPQTSTEEWETMVGLHGEEYSQLVQTIGNLTFATHSDNSRMGNKPKEDKNAILRETSHIVMNMKIIEKDEWTKEDIETRTQEIIKKICELYNDPHYLPEDIVTSFGIFDRTNENSIIGRIFDDEKVEIESGSTFNIGEKSLELMELIDEGYIKAIGNECEFNETILFDNLDAASIVVFNREGAGIWGLWQDDTGESALLSLRTKIKNAISKKRNG